MSYYGIPTMASSHPPLFRDHRFRLYVGQTAQFASEGADLVGGAFNDEGDEMDTLVTQGQSLAGQNKVCELRKKLVHLGNNVAVADEDADASDSLFH